MRADAGPYGALGTPNAAGVAVPAGFAVRTVATANQLVGTSAYPFPIFPDGSATCALPDGGWVLVVNSEVPGGQGGASAIEFAPDGAIRTGRRILGGSSGNCAGGATPWGTWLSCEEVDAGYVFECDPMGVKAAVRRDGLGVFKHEAACVDPAGRRVYLTEDIGDSGLYRFTPDAYPDLSKGVLEIATDGGAGLVAWRRLPDPSAATTPTRNQVAGTLRFKRGEGISSTRGSCTSRRRATIASTPTTPPRSASRCSTTARRSPAHRCTRSTTSRATRRRATCSWPRTPIVLTTPAR